MQSTPPKLLHAIWTAFRTSRPVNRSLQLPAPILVVRKPWRHSNDTWRTAFHSSARHYSESKSDVDKKSEEAHKRINEVIESRGDVAAGSESVLKKPEDETIVHTDPESSSIVHNTSKSGEDAARDAERKVAHTEPLPSHISSMRSQMSKRFSYFMDNFQSQLFVASRRLNDLTGYTGIEALKKRIEEQEDLVQQTRQLVKDTRLKYTAAIDNRSATQREVNDLLHRKHAWTAADLERFTNLYRSDHANEQAEQKAQEELGKAESQYEEASTKLAKGILARYHEEQIWSDKIRQMSTWGTWGLMGLNVLLFVIFQIAVEPWRRSRLVKGFEERVQLALNEKHFDKNQVAEADKLIEQISNEQPDEDTAVMAGEQIAAAIVDAVSGTTDEQSDTDVEIEKIETAAEQSTDEDLALEEANTATVMAVAESVEEGVTPDIMPMTEEEPVTSNSFPPNLKNVPWQEMPSVVYASVSSGYAQYEDKFRTLFDEKQIVTMSRKEMTASMLESAAVGAISMATFLWVFGRGR